MNITPLCFVDTSQMTANLLVHYKTAWDSHKLRQTYPDSPHHATKTIVLRGPAEPSLVNWFEDCDQIDYPIMEKFKSAARALSKIKGLVSPWNDNKPGEIGKAMIVSLQPGGFVDWHTDEGEYAEAHNRLHICLVPADGALCIYGGQAVAMAVGVINSVNNRVPHSAINPGLNARIHLIVDIRKP